MLAGKERIEKGFFCQFWGGCGLLSLSEEMGFSFISHTTFFLDAEDMKYDLAVHVWRGRVVELKVMWDANKRQAAWEWALYLSL